MYEVYEFPRKISRNRVNYRCEEKNWILDCHLLDSFIEFYTNETIICINFVSFQLLRVLNDEYEEVRKAMKMLIKAVTFKP